MVTLLQKVARPSNLKRAWNSIKHKADSKGFDLQTISDFRANLDTNIKLIRSELLEQSYSFTKLRGSALKKDGEIKIRPLRIPAVRDRVVQKAIQYVIEKRLNRIYKINNPVSFAYIEEKSVWHAIKEVRSAIRSGLNWIYIADIQNFFGSISPQILLETYIFPILSDNSLNSLISKALSTEIGNYAQMLKLGYGDEFLTDEIGIAQGGILSPLFANVYLNELDKTMIKKRLKMIRYADDFVVMCDSEVQARESYKIAKQILEDKLGLKLHDIDSKKSEIKIFSHLDFLGVRFEGDAIYPGAKAFKKMITSLKKITKESPKGNAIQDLVYLRERSQSWAATYFYTDIKVEHYVALETHFINALKATMKRYGFMTKKETFTRAELKKIGIPDFGTRLLDIKRIKKEKIREFNQFAAS